MQQIHKIIDLDVQDEHGRRFSYQLEIVGKNLLDIMRDTAILLTNENGDEIMHWAMWEIFASKHELSSEIVEEVEQILKDSKVQLNILGLGE